MKANKTLGHMLRNCLLENPIQVDLKGRRRTTIIDNVKEGAHMT